MLFAGILGETNTRHERSVDGSLSINLPLKVLCLHILVGVNAEYDSIQLEANPLIFWLASGRESQTLRVKLIRPMNVANAKPDYADSWFEFV